MRDRLKSRCLAQALVLLQQLAEFAVTERAKRHGDSSQQQKGERREVPFLAACGRRGWGLWVVFFDALDEARGARRDESEMGWLPCSALCDHQVVIAIP